MSEVERNKGTLIPLFLANVMEEDHLEAYLDENYDTKIRIGEWVYDIQYEVKGDTDGCNFADVTHNANGTIDFHTMHYNGCSFSDVINSALRQLEK